MLSDSVDEDSDLRLTRVDTPDRLAMESCDVVRRKIRNFMDSGVMNITQFCKTIGVSNRSYNTFMHQHGSNKGIDPATYENALLYFAKRDAAGLKMPKKPKVEASKSDANSRPDLSSIKLEGAIQPDVFSSFQSSHF